MPNDTEVDERKLETNRDFKNFIETSKQSPILYDKSMISDKRKHRQDAIYEMKFNIQAEIRFTIDRQSNFWENSNYENRTTSQS